LELAELAVIQLLAEVVQIHNLHRRQQPSVVAVAVKTEAQAQVLMVLTAVLAVAVLMSQPQAQAQLDKETMEQQVQHQVA
jgi:EAL domain-containing protein (putative c-di-GMP-specific phosphodiesterase class I)